MAKLLLLTLLVACNAAELILDGGDNGWSQWYRSVDGVMGGRSSISVKRDGDVLEASGEIVTAGGGFAGLYRRLDDVRRRRSRSKSSEGPSLDSLHSISRL